MTEEPLWTRAGITGAVGAVLVLLVSFGVPLNQGQQVGILGVFSIVAPLIVAMVTRSKVTPYPTVPPTDVETGGYPL